MNIKLTTRREEEIIDFIKSLSLEEKYKNDFTVQKRRNLSYVNEALTHSSSNHTKNYENLEFLGDAVLRLIASDFIKKKYPNMPVGERSELRSQLVSDQWLKQVGEKIAITNLLIIGPKAMGDQSAKGTIQAEATEALIGALYESLNRLEPIRNWLMPFWEEKSKEVLADPHKNNYKSALQEWSQSKGYLTPIYKTIEKHKEHGNLKRFFCNVFIKGHSIGEGWGGSIKQAEKNAANEALKYLKKNTLDAK